MKYLFVFLSCQLIINSKTYAQFYKINNDDEHVKIEHADPVFEDLTTDLGARMGENQLNLNFGYRKLKENHNVLLSQFEYEIAPLNNLGIEVLIPYSVYFNNRLDEQQRPENRMEFFQWGAQYTFFKSTERNISMAVAFRNILETQDPNQNNSDFDLERATYNPFLIFGKNWDDKFFLLLSGGAEIIRKYNEGETEVSVPVNTAIHYKFSEKDHFIGVEFNKSFEDGEFELFIRPQVTLQLAEDFTLGAAIGLPVGVDDMKRTGFLRLAYEIN